MKALILSFALIILGTSFSMATSYPTKQIHQYKRAQKQTIALPTNFAKPFIIDQKDIDLLAGKTIHHVELIYTKYAKSATFNQKTLNNQRITQLKKVLPQVISDNPSWTWLEQTGAKTQDVAHDYFHGFVIHYGDKLDHTTLGDFLSDIAGDANQLNVNASTGGTFKIASGTTIHIPTDAVSYKNGKKVVGDFILSYTEYRNQAEIALSGLPMLYKGDNFSSIGMYELRGEKDGKELKLNKAITVDFNCTKVVNDAAFFSMDDNSGEWKKIKDLNFPGQAMTAEQEETLFAIDERGNVATAIVAPKVANIGIKWTTIDNETIEAVLDSATWVYNKGLDPTKLAHMVISKNEKTRSFMVKKKMKAQFQARVTNQVYSKGTYDEFWGGAAPKSKGKNTNINVQKSIAGHTYPTVVSGLRSPSFGVYNCDQVYRLKPAVVLSPIYTDQDSKKQIEDGYVACVIDLSKNGSFSFHPSNLTVNKNGRNAILLFTEEKEIYLIDERAFSKLDLDNRQTIEMPMRNVTSMIKSPSDLKKMLNI